VGAAPLENRLRGKKQRPMKMDVLFVSRQYRGKCIARALVEMVSDLARERGAGALYISATPSHHTVEFYKSCGAMLAEELDTELFEMEPEDIHPEILL
jgi:GNAT superfamily N-acetyltransferase